LNFDNTVWFYDTLARIVLGRAWRKVQLAPIAELNQARNVLIVGGGTGQILSHLDRNVKVTYLELSQKMIGRAKLRKTSAKVEFVQADFLQWQTESKYDCILMPFFLDCFEEEQIQEVIAKAKHLLNSQAQLIILDFQRARKWQNILVQLMYIFFRLFVGLKGSKLLDFDSILLENGVVKKSKINFLNEWVFMASYQVGAVENPRSIA
jgi:ubiquinone/menaquinone biosynthesis C-methylase UbiE